MNHFIKRFFCALCAVLAASLFAAPLAFAESDRPQMLGSAYIVVDADTGQVLIEQNADTVYFPASITKIMTLALAIEKAEGDWETQLTVSHEAVYSLERNSAHIALIENETVRLEDMLYATAICSANDAANVLAAYIGQDGTIQSGVDAMNEKAAELALADTHFINPHGLHDDQHYTSARDMALITRWAMSVPGFETVFCRSEMWTMKPTDLQPKERYFSIDDWMRLSGKYYRSYAKGSKNGFHDQAHYTFVNYAQQDGINLISVVLGCPQRYDKFKDACSVLDYCYAHYHRVEIPAPADNFKVSLMGGGGKIGEISVQAVGASVLLHDDFVAGDISADYVVPSEYVLGLPFEASVTFSLKQNSLQPSALGGEALKVDGLPEILQANTYVPAKKEKETKFDTTILLLALVACLLPGGIFVVRKATAHAVKHKPKGLTRNQYGILEIPVANAYPVQNFESRPERDVNQTGKRQLRRKNPTKE